jgi:methylmalonyl-CoA mutase N-terminal domain/subunit
MYLAMAENRGMPLAVINGTTEGDPTSFGGCFDHTSMPVKQITRLCGDLVEWCATHAPKWNPVSFTSYNYREAGVNAYQEIGGLISSAVAIIEEVINRDRGLTVDDFVPQFAFHLSAHNDFFEEIAKMRAARKMWAQLMTEKYNAKNPRTKTLRFHVQTAGSTLTYQQPINNAIRAAYQSLAAVLGGVQSLHVCSYDEAICNPTEEAAILSVRTQQILQNESNVINTVDPLAGSYFVESLTKEIEERAWVFYKELEEQGGWTKATETGWIQTHREGEVCRYEQEIRTGERRMVGVNCYKDDEKTAKISIFRADPRLGERLRERLEKLKKERNNDKIGDILEELREADDRGDNVMPAVMKAVKAYATVEEITDITVRRYPCAGSSSPMYGLKGVLS